MITNPTDYLNLLVEIQNSQSYYPTTDTKFQVYKNYYKQVIVDVSDDDETVNPQTVKYEYQLRNDYTVGTSIADWALQKITADPNANITVYERLGIDKQTSQHFRTAILLPTDELIYEVDLNKRTVDVPQFLSVQKEHYAETLYFKMARYFDNIDLSQMTCIVQYENAEGEGGIYAVPFVDVETFKATNEMLVPWAIGGTATKYPGTIKFVIRFYKINTTTLQYEYNLSTQATESKILYGFNPPDSTDIDYEIEATKYDELKQLIDQVSAATVLYWKNV